MDDELTLLIPIGSSQPLAGALGHQIQMLTWLDKPVSMLAQLCQHGSQNVLQMSDKITDNLEQATWFVLSHDSLEIIFQVGLIASESLQFYLIRYTASAVSTEGLALLITAATLFTASEHHCRSTSTLEIATAGMTQQEQTHLQPFTTTRSCIQRTRRLPKIVKMVASQGHTQPHRASYHNYQGYPSKKVQQRTQPASSTLRSTSLALVQGERQSGLWVAAATHAQTYHRMPHHPNTTIKGCWLEQTKIEAQPSITLPSNAEQPLAINTPDIPHVIKCSFNDHRGREFKSEKRRVDFLVSTKKFNHLIIIEGQQMSLR